MKRSNLNLTDQKASKGFFRKVSIIFSSPPTCNMILLNMIYAPSASPLNLGVSQVTEIEPLNTINLRIQFYTDPFY